MRTVGFALMEILVAASLLAIAVIGVTQALLSAIRWGSVARMMTASQAVVQRNIDTALTVGFSGTSTPPILAITPASGVVYDDDGGGDNKVNIAVADGGTTTLVKGTLTRIVTAVPNAEGADIRRITFRNTFTFRERAYTTEITTLRTNDD
jgi:type II secretory pathway pseudopilin PulG